MKSLTYVVLALPLPVVAGDFAVVVDTWSHHTAPTPRLLDYSDTEIPAELLDAYRLDWNEHNEAMGVEYTTRGEDWDTVYTLATYTDSYGRETWYGGAGWMYQLVEGSDWRVSAGGSLLYFKHSAYSVELPPPPGFSGLRYQVPSNEYVTPLPGLSVSWKRVGANIAVIPPLFSDGPWTGVLQVKIIL